VGGGVGWRSAESAPFGAHVLLGERLALGIDLGDDVARLVGQLGETGVEVATAGAVSVMVMAQEPPRLRWPLRCRLPSWGVQTRVGTLGLPSRSSYARCLTR
jgi:hypothetical protein